MLTPPPPLPQALNTDRDWAQLIAFAQARDLLAVVSKSEGAALVRRPSGMKQGVKIAWPPNGD